MLKQHEEKIKEDEKDLENLQLQIEKVQKLKREHSKQKQQIVNLKHAIQDLKSQNEELKSQSCKNQKSPSNHKKQRIEIDTNTGQEGSKKNKYRYPVIKGRNDASDKGRNDISDQIDTIEFGTRSKLWNENQKYRNGKKRVEKLNLNSGFNQQNNQQGINPCISIRNHPGLASSTGRLLSPQPGKIINYDHRKDQRYLNRTQIWGEDFQQKFSTNYISTKNKLIDNLVSDLRYEIQEKEDYLNEQKASHKHTKKALKKTLNQNEKLAEMNNQLLANYELLQKQNQFLKQEIKKQTEAKYKIESSNKDYLSWHSSQIKRYNDEFELEMLAMDAIYYDFERICSGKGYILNS